MFTTRIYKDTQLNLKVKLIFRFGLQVLIEEQQTFIIFKLTKALAIKNAQIVCICKYKTR